MTVEDTTIANFLLEQSMKTGKNIIIKTDTQKIIIGNNLTLSELYSKFLKYKNENPKIGLEGDF